MEKSGESSSDSDSNSSTSWVFVYDNSPQVQQSSNTFHLDCSREPIQELTEQDLLSAGSDIESDTDGISVISESELPNDDPSPTGQTTSSNSGVEEVEDDTTVIDDSCETILETTLIPKESERVANNELKKNFKSFNMLGLGFVLTAVFLASYNQIMTKLYVKDARNLQENNGIISYDEVNLMTADTNKKIYNGKRNMNRELEEIVDITISCTYGDKPKSEVRNKEIKKCVKKQYKTKGISCLKKNAKLSDEESFKCNNEIPKKFSGKLDTTLVQEDVIERVGNHNYKEAKHKYKKKNKGKNYVFYNADADIMGYSFKKGKVEKYEKSGNKENSSKDKLKHKKYKSKENFRDGRKQEQVGEKREYKNQILQKKPNKHQRDKKEHRDFNLKKSNYVDKKFEFKRNIFNKNVNKHPVNRDSRNYKDKDNLNKSSIIIKHKDAAKLNSKEQLFVVRQQQNGTSGEWYTNLHKARTQIRKQEHVSDWVFDRAHLRNKKRNKAQWYFKWMNVREQLRYKQSYRPYSS